MIFPPRRTPTGCCAAPGRFTTIVTGIRRSFRSKPTKNYGVDLNRVRLEPGFIVLQRTNGLDDIKVPVDAENIFDSPIFSTKLPPGRPTHAKAFTVERVWHMGIVLAARALNLDLAAAQVDLPHGRIVFRGANGVSPNLARGCQWVLLHQLGDHPHGRAPHR